MSKFKHAALALAAASLMAVQAQATEVQAQSPQAVPFATFSQADINTMFEQAGQPMQLAALSGQEMKDTEGAWGFASFFGAGVGMYTYGLSCSSCSVRGFAAAGAFGAFAPVSSVTRFYGSMGLATGYGVGSRRGWW